MLAGPAVPINYIVDSVLYQKIWIKMTIINYNNKNNLFHTQSTCHDDNTGYIQSRKQRKKKMCVKTNKNYVLVSSWLLLS